MQLKQHQIESWTLRVIEALLKGEPVEYDLVEVKAEWPPVEGDQAERVARRIAGHANSARRQPILWIIGIDESQREVIGASEIEMATWWSRVQSRFSELAPKLQYIVVPFEDTSVGALCFSTQRPPYVVGRGDKIAVPWRDGTRTRSAKRTELMALLSEVSRLPHVELLDGRMMIHLEHEGNLTALVKMELYITPGSEEPITFPNHKLTATLSLPDLGDFTATSGEFTRDKHRRLLMVKPGESFPRQPPRTEGVLVAPSGATWERPGRAYLFLFFDLPPEAAPFAEAQNGFGDSVAPERKIPSWSISASLGLAGPDEGRVSVSFRQERD